MGGDSIGVLGHFLKKQSVQVYQTQCLRALNYTKEKEREREWDTLKSKK